MSNAHLRPNQKRQISEMYHANTPTEKIMEAIPCSAATVSRYRNFGLKKGTPTPTKPADSCVVIVTTASNLKDVLRGLI